jgi:hypothetical protein
VKNACVKEIRTALERDSYFFREAMHCHSLNLDDANLASMHPVVAELVMNLRKADAQRCK